MIDQVENIETKTASLWGKAITISALLGLIFVLSGMMLWGAVVFALSLFTLMPPKVDVVKPANSHNPQSFDLQMLDHLPLVISNDKGDLIKATQAYQKLFTGGEVESPRMLGLSCDSKASQMVAIGEMLVECQVQPFADHNIWSFVPKVAQTIGSDDLQQQMLSADSLFHILDDAPISVATINRDGQFVRVNKYFNKFCQKQLNLEPKVKSVFVSDLCLDSEEDDVKDVVARAFEKQFRSMPLEIHASALPDEVVKMFVRPFGDDKVEEVMLYFLDTTELKLMETQFVQAQKMQAVGQLAGGIAHDFNNLLTAITGFCDLLLQCHGPGDASFADLMQIKQNSNRAANLVRQLLAFSRRQTLRPQVLDIGEVLSDISNLVRRLIGEKVHFEIVHGRSVPKVKADVGQLEQVFINLAVNARDAMASAGGGDLTFRTGIISKEQVAELGHSVMVNDDYVHVTVKDTGSGMSEAIQQQIFQPFFTTKKVGEGTGLGLSTVYGIVKQTGGYIFVDSEEGMGTTFNIYLPIHHAVESEKEAPTIVEVEMHKDLTGQETILLVEDEAPVRLFAKRALENKGYEVLIADSGETAMEVLEQYDGHIDLLISDIIMPGVDGPSLARTIKADRPDLKIIFMSGYAEEEYREQLSEFVCEFLPKPFSLVKLAEVVKDSLA